MKMKLIVPTSIISLLFIYTDDLNGILGLNDSNDIKLVVNKRNNFILVVLLIVIASVLSTWMMARQLEFGLLLTYIIAVFHPYLSRGSRLKIQSAGRTWNDKLILTSLIYLVASAISIWLEEFQIATLCLITCIGSTLYHLHREVRYFNLDNIFATSLLVIFMYSLVSSYYLNQTYFLAGVLGLPVAAFLLVYCGMPADVTMDASGTCCTRSSRPLYDSVHTLWHLVSGTGPVLSAWYFYSLRAQGERQFDDVDGAGLWEGAAIMPAVAVLVGVCINVVGNIAGVMPLD